jgi:hypothetical protein
LPLVGVVLGGLLAGGTAYFLERARERRGARAAALLVRDEMKQIRTTLDISVASFGGIVIDAKEWDTSQWQAHRNTLAAGLAPKVWGSIADAYRGLRFVHKKTTALPEGRRKPLPEARSQLKKPTSPGSRPLARATRSREKFEEAINQLEKDVGLPRTEFHSLSRLLATGDEG